MIRPLSLPLIVTASISMILGLFFILLYYRLSSRYQEPVRYYFIFSMSALVSGIFLGAFAVLLNSGDNLDCLNISNRITIISAMFTIILGLHFNVSFFEYKPPVSLKWGYGICVIFSLLCMVPSKLFLAKEFYKTSSYYTGLVFGPLFQLWGVWIFILSIYTIMILFRVYLRQRKKNDKKTIGAAKLLLTATFIWLIAGIGDDLTGMHVLDLPPLTWIGSFLVTCSITWILVLHIDDLYEDRRLLNNRLMYDYLTQAFSRSYFEVRLLEAIRSIRRNDFKELTVCLFDIDDFKAVNDQYGHANGDNLLKGISNITKNAIRPFDCFARLGGDEFALLLTGIQEESMAVKVVERIKNNITETRFGISPCEFGASCSFGLVRAGKEHLTIKDLPAQLLVHADNALYDSKHKGKNTVSVSTLPKIKGG